MEYSAQPPAKKKPSARDTPCVGILKALLREGVSRPTWILQKDMSKSDVSSKQSRLLLTRNPVMQTLLRDLITSDEAALVNDRHQGLPVRVFDRLGREYAMKFKSLTCNGGFRLIGSWGCFVKCNELRVGDSVRVWAFRCRGDLGMAQFNGDFLSGLYVHTKMELSERAASDLFTELILPTNCMLHLKKLLC